MTNEELGRIIARSGIQAAVQSGAFAGSGGGSAVDSVNGKTGAVTLSASDVGAATTAQGTKADSAVQPAALTTKVDVVAGKGLSTNDYTTSEKTKLAALVTGPVVEIYRGVVPANTSVTAAIANNNLTPVATDGTSFISATTTAIAGQKIEVEVVLPYVSLTGTTGPATAHLFANGVAIASLTKRLTTGSTSGDGYYLKGFIDSATAGTLTLDARIGPDVNTNSLLLNSKFNGLSQGYMIVKKY